MFQVASTPAPTAFNCAVTAALPFGGAEVLVLTLVLLALIVAFCVVFIDVGVKQMWPSKFLDPAVQARVAQIQAAFPKLGGGTQAAPQADAVSVVKPATTIDYDQVVATDPYIAGLSVDEDLIHILANNKVFSTVSSYCSSTVRGYAMLSTTLMCAGMCLSYLWTHNALVDPTTGDTASKFALLGYMLVFLTGIVMCGSNGNAVYRNANIALFGNLSTSPETPLLRLHEVGIVSFILLPLLAHGYRAYTLGHSMPNYAGTITGISLQLSGAIAFGLANWLGGKCGISKVFAQKCSILAEIFCVFMSFAAFMQYEFYATAVCANYLTQFTSLLGAAMALPIARLCAKHYKGAPTSFVTPASVMLMKNGQPVAIAGPASALSFDQQNLVIPSVPES